MTQQLDALRTLLVTTCLILWAFGCGSESDETIQEIVVEGRSFSANQAALPGAEIQMQFVLEGRDLFGEKCSQLPDHMAATYSQRVRSTDDGSFQFRIPIQELSAAVSAKCKLEKLEPSRVQGFRINSSILADSQSCQSYCDGPTQNSASCVQECSEGGRLLQSSHILTRSEIDALLSEPEGSGVKWPINLTFATLGPPIREGLGPDLVPDGDAALRTVRVTEEAFSSNGCGADSACVRADGNRKLLRFDGVIRNLGGTDLEVGIPTDDSRFELDQCHQHYHASNALLYQLVNTQTLEVVQVGGQDVVGKKQSFCLMDSFQVSGRQAASKFTCDFQGISAGWGDIYESGLECQFLDISDVPAGEYFLRITVNPDGAFPEMDAANNSVNVPVTLSG